MLNHAWKLTGPDGGDAIEPGATITSFRDEAAVFHAITKAPDGCSNGRIQVGDGHGPEYYPSVFGLRIVPRQPGELITEPIPDSRFWQRMAAGHKIRTGHELAGYLTTAEDGISVLHRTCCPEQEAGR
jgi:hypothetical protein